jgi:hypothetical protein
MPGPAKSNDPLDETMGRKLVVESANHPGPHSIGISNTAFSIKKGWVIGS